MSPLQDILKSPMQSKKFLFASSSNFLSQVTLMMMVYFMVEVNVILLLIVCNTAVQILYIGGQVALDAWLRFLQSNFKVFSPPVKGEQKEDGNE